MEEKFKTILFSIYILHIHIYIWVKYVSIKQHRNVYVVKVVIALREHGLGAMSNISRVGNSKNVLEYR